MRKREVLELILLLGLLFGFLPHLARADTAMLQKSGNNYQEDQAKASFDMESKINSTTFYDFSLNGNHGRNYGVTENEIGVYGKAVKGVLTDTSKNITSDYKAGTKTWTWMGWYKPTTLVQQAYIVRKWNGSLSGENYAIRDFFGELRVSFYDLWLNGQWYWTTSGFGLSTTKYQHITWVNDYPARTWRLYRNGTSFQNLTYNSNINIVDPDSKLVLDYPDAGTNTAGYLDEVRAFDTTKTQTQIQTYMNTPIQTQLTINGLTPNTDIAQLWYNSTNLWQQAQANANGQVSWNVFDFSAKTSPYQAIIKIYHKDIQYEGPVLVLYWGDIYTFSVVGLFEDLFTQFLYGAGAWIGTLVILTISMGLTFKWKESAVLVVPVLLFLSLDFLGKNLMWQAIIMLSAATFFVLNFAKKMRH